MPETYANLITLIGTLTVVCLLLTTAVGLGATAVPRRFARFALRWDRHFGGIDRTAKHRLQFERAILHHTRAFGAVLLAVSLAVLYAFLMTLSENANLVNGIYASVF